MLLVVDGSGHERHDPGSGHPERPVRIAAVRRGIDAAHLDGALRFDPGRAATREEVELIHDRRYLDGLAAMSRAGGGELDPDTPVGPDSFDAALGAAGLGLAAIDALAAGAADAAFVLPRPPGHHASAAMGMGFCLLNNVAIAAAHLRAGGARVLIVDWDVHHGNGTQAIFWDDPAVLLCSVHQSPAYPGTGRADEVGGVSAPGATVNVPLPPGATGDVVRAALDQVLAPEVERFQPDWVLVSSGFDAHRDDPLAELCLTSGDFAALARQVVGFAPAPGRTVLFLEGGYDLGALACSAGAVVAALVGADHGTEPPTSGGPGRTQVAACAERRLQALELAW